MKQHITIEQLNELSDKTKWISWINKDHLPWDGGTHIRLEDDDKVSLVTSIGQMIEFLDEHKIDFRIDGAWRGGYYTLYTKYEPHSEGFWYEDTTHSELVDLLWEAVKQVLETL